ncbi:MAG: type II secretion system protein [Elusimicrobiales bacterium]|nr:type II secretion system protein [Elusimicrobiales bacterium]
MCIKRHAGFTLMEVLVSTMIFSFVGLSMISVYYAANRNVLQNFRSDKLKADISTSMRAIGSVMAQATSVVTPVNGGSGNDLVVMSNVESGTSSPCCPLVPTGSPYYGPTPKWYRFCVQTTDAVKQVGKLWYYSGNVSTCNGCPNTSSYSIGRSGSGNVCGSTGNNRMLLATHINTAIPVFSRVKQPTTLTTTAGMLPRTNNTSHTRLVHPKHTVNVYLNTRWNIDGSENATQNPVDYTLESYFSVLQPR